MSGFWIAPEHLFDGEDIVSGQALRIVEGQVVEIANAPDNAHHIAGCLTPGFVDLQVNGGGGVMLNATPTPDAIGAIAAAHRKFGTVAIMPTVITDQCDVLEQAAQAVIAARGDAGVIGLHIEGPHISVARRGTHSAEHIRPMDAKTLDVVARLRAHDIAVMITVAPEAITQSQITQLDGLGAIVSLGHTDATSEAMERAIAAGARCATHLFNAMSPMTSRAPGAVGAVLNSTLYAGIICDGVHVDDRMIQLALRAHAQEGRMFLVSDAMATVGGPDQFELYGQTVHLEDGRLINTEGNLAGAHTTQAQGVARLVAAVNVPLVQALRMAITVPANVVGKAGLSRMLGRNVADIIRLSGDQRVMDTLGEVQVSLRAE